MGADSHGAFIYGVRLNGRQLQTFEPEPNCEHGFVPGGTTFKFCPDCGRPVKIRQIHHWNRLVRAEHGHLDKKTSEGDFIIDSNDDGTLVIIGRRFKPPYGFFKHSITDDGSLYLGEQLASGCFEVPSLSVVVEENIRQQLIKLLEQYKVKPADSELSYHFGLFLSVWTSY